MHTHNEGEKFIPVVLILAYPSFWMHDSAASVVVYWF